MSKNIVNKSRTFTFRLRPKELIKLKNVVEKIDCISMAQFVREAIKEKIKKVNSNEQ